MVMWGVLPVLTVAVKPPIEPEVDFVYIEPWYDVCFDSSEK
jgi:hypothetical protein